MTTRTPFRLSRKILATILSVLVPSLLIFQLGLGYLPTILVLLALSGLGTLLLSRSLAEPVSEMTDMACGMGAGDFSRRILSVPQDEIGVLALALNETALKLTTQFEIIETEKNQLMAILNGMVEGVLVTNGAGEIELINPALRTILDLDNSALGKTIIECLRNQTIHEAIGLALEKNTTEEKEVTVRMGSEERTLIFHTAPLPKAGGTVSVFYDVTSIHELENTRREFVANVSHELKTPLTNILGYAETLRGGALSEPATATRFIEKIENNALQLKNLVDDILRISEIESGRVELNRDVLSLKEIVSLVQQDLEDKINAKKLVVEQQIPAGLKVYADVVGLKQILTNLVENAIKYTVEGGKITVLAQAEPSWVKITVIDTGIGIPQKDLPHVFERFYRVDRARSRQLGGTGLGLSIVKHFACAHGGYVGAESEEGQGSRFFFTLPV